MEITNTKLKFLPFLDYVLRNNNEEEADLSTEMFIKQKDYINGIVDDLTDNIDWISLILSKDNNRDEK
jgi:hypothetical protein